MNRSRFSFLPRQSLWSLGATVGRCGLRPAHCDDRMRPGNGPSRGLSSQPRTREGSRLRELRE